MFIQDSNMRERYPRIDDQSIDSSIQVLTIIA